MLRIQPSIYGQPLSGKTRFSGHVVIQTPKSQRKYEAVLYEFLALVNEHNTGAINDTGYFSTHPADGNKDQVFIDLAKRYKLKVYHEPATYDPAKSLEWSRNSLKAIERALTAWQTKSPSPKPGKK